MLDDISHLKRFFGTYLNDTPVRAALQLAEIVANLHGCKLENFTAEVLKAAYHQDFNIETVERVLDAREDVLSDQMRREVLDSACESIDAIKTALNPAAPPRSSSLHPTPAELPVATTSSTAAYRSRTVSNVHQSAESAESAESHETSKSPARGCEQFGFDAHRVLAKFGMFLCFSHIPVH